MGVFMAQSFLLEPTDAAQWKQLVQDAEHEFGQVLHEANRPTD